MSKRRRTNPNNKFVMLERWFWRCPAWQALPHPARSLYCELELLYDGKNNGDIGLGVRRASELLDCSINHVRKMFAELEDKGFTAAVQRGAFAWKSRHTTTWRLTRYECKGKPSTSEFMRWRPSERQKSVSPRDTDGITTRCRDGAETPPTVSPRDTVKADSGGSTVSPRDTQYSIPPTPLSKTKPKRALVRTAPPTASPHAQVSFAPKGNRQAKADWLRSHLEAGTLTTEAVARALEIEPGQVAPIAAGKVELAGTSWRKLGALVGARMNLERRNR
jgi:hypothetical protein